jgi:hypothetical protein
MPRFAIHTCAIAAAIMLAGPLTFVPTGHSRFSTTSLAWAAQNPAIAEFNRRQKLFDVKRYDEVIPQAAELLDHTKTSFGITHSWTRHSIPHWSNTQRARRSL